MNKLLLFIGICIVSFCSCKKTIQRPNVILILADDLGYGDLSCLGQTKLQTPNIDRLASEGITFTNHYSGNTVCSPSRAVLLTGQDPGHVHCRGNTGYRYLDSSMVTLPRLFKNAGYNTGAFGKWGLGTTNSEGISNPLTHGFDEFYGPRTQTSAHTYFSDRLVHNGKVVSVKKDDYMHSLVIEHALDFIEQSVSNKKPFFCYIPTPIPHAAMHAPKEIHDKWRERFPEFDSIIGKYSAGEGEACPSVVNPIAGFAAMMEVLDTDVGRILATLKELGVDENTMVLLISDNGTHLEGGHDPDFWNSNGPFRGHKRDLYEGGIHTPALVRWPTVISPSTSSDHISAFWDILPTMAEITEQTIPSQVDGISFLPTLKGSNDDQEKHDYLFFEFWQGRKPKLVSQAVRFGDWKALRSAKFLEKSQEDVPLSLWPVELYNLSQDIGEQKNIAIKHPELVEKAKNIMQIARVNLTN